MTQATELRELATLLDVSSNNVGIGLPSGTPSNNLVISDGVRTSAAITAGTTALEIARTSGGDVGILINKDTSKWLIGIDNSDGNAGPLRFMYGAYNAAAHPGFGSDYSGLNLAYDGKVGIGTKTPAATFQVGNLVSGEEGNVIINSAGGNPVGLKVASRTNRARIQVADNDTSGFIIAEGSIFSLGFADQASDNNVNITNAYDVGIGTQTPAHKLDVVGAIGASQVRHSIRPSLNLDFANSKQLDPRITFYRDSIATYYDSKGILRYANHNEPRFDHDPYTGESKGLLIEESRTNIKNYSENENFLLGTDLGGFLIPNYAKSPSGKMDAFALFGDGSSSARASTGTTGAGTYTLSIYAKNNATNGAGRFGIWAYSGGWVYSNTFTWNGDTVTPSSTTDTEVEIIGDGWVRVHVTWTTTGNGSFQLSPGAYANYASGDSTLFWGLNLQSGVSFPTSHIPPDTSFTSRSSQASYFDEYGFIRKAPKDAPRYGYKYDGRKWVETGLILETQAVQRFDTSDAFHWVSYYPQVTRTRTTDYFSCGEGFTKVTPSTTNTSHVYDRYEVIASAGEHCFSVFAKASGYNYINMEMTFGGSAIFDLSNGTVYSTSNAIATHVEDYGNGIYRCAVSASVSQTSGLIQRVSVLNNSRQSSYAGDGTSSVELFGMQLEDGKVPTSLIFASLGLSTTTTRAADVASSAVYTRKADDAYIDDIQNYDWYSHDSGTLFAEHNVDRDITASAWGIVTIENEGSSDNYVGLRYRSSGTSGEVLNNNGISQISASSISAADLNYFNKGAITYETNSAAAVGNGGTVSTDSSVTVPNLTRMTIGTGYGIGYIGGHIKKIAYYPERLSNGEITALTENN